MNQCKTSIDMRRTGLKLQRLAKQNGYSVEDIRKYLCLSCPQPVYRWYKGTILPSVDNLLRLSELFRVHMEELLVKKHTESQLEEVIYCANDSKAFYRRMKAYCNLLAS